MKPRKIDFDKDNVVFFSEPCGRIKCLLDGIFLSLCDDRSVYFFEEGFTESIVKPEEPSMGGQMSLHDGNFEGIGTVLRQIISGKENVTLIIHWNSEDILSCEYLDLIRTAIREGKNCNIILNCDYRDEIMFLGFNERFDADSSDDWFLVTDFK